MNEANNPNEQKLKIHFFDFEKVIVLDMKVTARTFRDAVNEVLNKPILTLEDGSFLICNKNGAGIVRIEKA